MTAEITLLQQERPRPLASLIASARRLTSERIGGRGKGKRPHPDLIQQNWQADAWEMYDLVGEERFIASTLAGRLSQARLYVGRLSAAEPSDDPMPVEDPRINAVLQSFGGSQGGRAQLLRRLSINLFVAGDGWLVAVPDGILNPDDSSPTSILDDSVDIADLKWQMLSVAEVSGTGTGGLVRLQIGEDGEIVDVDPDDIYMIRVWRPHPRKWWEADSPTRANLPVLKELVGLTMHVSAQVDSRLAGAGMLIVPSTAQRALQASAGLSEDSGEDMFTEALIEAMLTPITDRSAAAALVPLVVTVPDEAVGGFKYLSFATPLDSEARSLRDEAIRRLALGQDAPPELLMGTSGMNHWGAWLTQEETVTTHIEPPLALICDALTTQYLWPVLEQMDVLDHESYVIWYDVSHMIARPNLGQDALVLHERGVISDDALRTKMGFDETDAPVQADDKAKVNEIVLRMAEANPALIQRPGLSVLIEQLTAVMQGLEPPIYDPSQARQEAVEEEVENPPGEVEPDRSSIRGGTTDKLLPRSDKTTGGTPPPTGVGEPELQRP